MPFFNGRDNSSEDPVHLLAQEFLAPSLAAMNRLHERLDTAEETIKRQQAAIRDLSALNKRNGSERAALEGKVAAQAGKIADLEAGLKELLSRFNEIDTRWTKIAGTWTAQHRPDVQRESDNRHHDVAAEYQLFRDTELYQLVTNPEWTSRPLPAVGQAVARADLSLALFDRQQPRTTESVRAVLQRHGVFCPDEEIAEICRRAADIDSRALALGRDQRWDFETGDGLFAPARQERVAGSVSGEPGEAVARVVAPGYAVGDGKLIVLQLVLTWLPARQAGGQQLGNARPQHPQPADSGRDEVR
jgi:hypothetical protein